MNRRELLATVGVASLGTVGVGGSTADGTVRRAGQSAGTYHNPVYDHVFPDPDVCRVGSTYYAYGTYHQWGEDQLERQLVPILRSSNLVDWEPVGPVFESEPAWSRYRGLWAPGVGRLAGRTLLYYSDAEFGADNPGVGVATEPEPTGPFEPRGGLFRSEDIGVPNAIDPMLFEGETPSLVWGSHRGIYGVRLADDGLAIAGEKFQIAGTGVEAPYVVERDGSFYLFGSRGTCCAGAESTYHVVVGRAERLRGPYHNRDGVRLTADSVTGTTVLEGDEMFRAPGHCAVVRDSRSGWWLLYHAYVAGKPWVGATPRRVLMLDRVRWHEGWPVVGADGTPSRVGQVPQAAHTGPA
ncbi:family 43 glycosylhydrolase [Halomicroarcula sp. F28]|uniref:family 43 glycosylhydrolase n=1 Tax=Haloarcula salinisoli TaxID=2487746 RepID=UPI001C72DC25|nr:family 43 glycosylhydrolase [Halomicroarcula salinisoli]MBX0286819.1 family 43 glycosylhydrolase [Halomicroarcula salinisoli]